MSPDAESAAASADAGKKYTAENAQKWKSHSGEANVPLNPAANKGD